MELYKNYIKIVEQSIFNAEKNLSRINDKILTIPGMSGTKTRHFLNNVVQQIGNRYLEIGVWAGSTFCSALNGSITNKECVACDNWTEFGGPKNLFFTNVNTYLDTKRLGINFLEKDCFQITKEDLEIDRHGKFSIYLYDGPHKRNEHYQALTKFIDYMEDTFVYLCDDWNWTNDVEYGTRDAFKDLNLTIQKEWVMKTPHDIESDSAGWWNGYYAAVITK